MDKKHRVEMQKQSNPLTKSHIFFSYSDTTMNISRLIVNWFINFQALIVCNNTSSLMLWILV
jgi:hypothetical protein